MYVVMTRHFVLQVYSLCPYPKKLKIMWDFFRAVSLWITYKCHTLHNSRITYTHTQTHRHTHTMSHSQIFIILVSTIQHWRQCLSSTVTTYDVIDTIRESLLSVLNGIVMIMWSNCFFIIIYSIICVPSI